jgi:hypothetical protein
VLNAAGVSTYQVAPYLAYARQVWKLQQTHHGLTLARQVAIVITRCVAMSLEQSVLELIRSQVFDVPAPGPS